MAIKGTVEINEVETRIKAKISKVKAFKDKTSKAKTFKVRTTKTKETEVDNGTTTNRHSITNQDFDKDKVINNKSKFTILGNKPKEIILSLQA